jgi:hypothetical protein
MLAHQPLMRGLAYASGWQGDLGQGGVEEGGGCLAGRGELGFEVVDQGHQLVDFGHDAALFGERRERDRDLFNLPDPEAVKAAAGDCQSLHFFHAVWRVQKAQNEIGNRGIVRAASDHVILVDAIANLTIPFGATTDFSEASIPFNDQYVARFQAATLELTGLELEFFYVR